MQPVSGDRLPQPLAEALQHVPTVLVQDPATSITQLGKLYLNLPELLGHNQLTQRELQRLLQLILCKDITSAQLVNKFQDAEQQQQQTAGAANNWQPNTVEAAASAQQLGILPWHTLILSRQPLGIEGLAQLFLQLKTTQRLRSLVASHCNISGTFTGDILQPTKDANHHVDPDWISRLRWLDLSHNPQLQLLGPEDEDDQNLWTFLDFALELQGLCLQYTGLTSIQLQTMLTAMRVLLQTVEQRPGLAFADRSEYPLLNLQCLKLGPMSPDPDKSSTAAGTSSSSSHQTLGWPAAAFADLYERLSNFEPPFNQVVVLELHGLSQQQQQHIADFVDRVSRLLSCEPDWKPDMMINNVAEDQPHVSQPQPDCCRISWLKPRQLLEFEGPVAGLDWRLPPPKPVRSTTPAAAAQVDAGAHTAAAPFAMPASAESHWLYMLAAGTGWTVPPPSAAAAGSGGRFSRPQQPQQQPARALDPAAVGSKTIFEVLGIPGSFAYKIVQHRTTVPLAAAAAAADIPSAAHQHTSRMQQQPRQHKDRRQQRVKQHTARQPGINDYADEDWPQQREQQHQQHDIHAIAAYIDADDHFMDPINSRQRQQRRRRQRPSPSFAAAAGADQGILLGSQDSHGAAADGSPRGRDGGILADLIDKHHDDLFSEDDNDDRMFVFSALRTRDQADEGLRTGSGSGLRQQQQPTRGKRKKRILQPIQFDDYASSPAAAGAGCGLRGSSPAHRLPPLESPLSHTGLDFDHTPPGSWQQQQQDSMESPTAAVGRSDEDEDDAASDQHDVDSDADSGRFIAADNDQGLIHGKYSQDGSGSQDHGDGTLQQHGQQQQRRGFGEDDDPEELKPFAFEQNKHKGQGLGRLGQDVWGVPEEGKKRWHKPAIGDKVQAALQRLKSRSEKQQLSGDQALGQAQPLLQPRGASAGAGHTAAGIQGGEVVRLGSRKAGTSHRRPKGGRNRFVDDAAGGGGSYGYEDELLTGSSSSSSEDRGGSDPPAGRRRIVKSTAAERHGAASVGQVVQNNDGATAAAEDDDDDDDPGEADEPLVPTAAAAACGSSKHRRRVAVLDSELQDEPDPLDAMLQQHYEQQQQQWQDHEEVDHIARVSGSRRQSRVAVLDSEPQDEPDPLDAMLKQHSEQQQQQQRQDHEEVDHIARAGGSRCQSRVAVLDSEPQDEPDPLDAVLQQHYEQQQQPAQVNPGPAGLSKCGNPASKAVLQSISKQHCSREATTSQTQRQQQSANPRLQGAAPAAQAAAATAGPQLHVCTQPHGNAESSSQLVDDEASDQPEDLDSIPQWREWQEAAAELKQLQKVELQLQQKLQAALATTAAAAADAAPEVVPPAPPAVTVTAGDTSVHEKTAPSAGLLADSGVSAAVDVTATDGAAEAVAVEAVGDCISSLQQQLESAMAKRQQQQRLVKVLKSLIPFHYDKSGPEARSFHINQVQSSKRQSRVPTRLSPGAIEQQERLMRAAQQQQQRGVLPVQPAAAEMTLTLPARKGGSGTKSVPASRHKGVENESDSARSSSSSSESDSQDDVPLATFYQQRRHSSTQPAGPAGDTLEPKGRCPGEADGNGASKSDARERISVQQHQQHTGGETGTQHGPAVAREKDPSTLAAVAAAAVARDSQPPSYTAAAVPAAGGDGSGGRRRTPRITAGQASKEFSEVFGSGYYMAVPGMPLSAAAAAAANAAAGSSSAAAEAGQADGIQCGSATGLKPAAVTMVACPLPVSAATALQQEQQQQQHFCVTTVAVTAAAAAAAAACATTAAVVAHNSSSQPGPDVDIDRDHQVQEPPATAPQLASAQVQAGQQQQPPQQPQVVISRDSSQPQQQQLPQQSQDVIAHDSSQPQQQQQQLQDIVSQDSGQQQQLLQQSQDLCPQQSSQQQQETKKQQHQLDPESSAAGAGQGASGVSSILQGPVAQAQHRQAPGRHQIASEAAPAVAPHAPNSAAAAADLTDPGQLAAEAPSLVLDAAPTAAICASTMPPAVLQEGQLVVDAAAAAAVRTEQQEVSEPSVPRAAVDVAVGSVVAAPGAPVGEEPPELEIPDSEEDE